MWLAYLWNKKIIQRLIVFFGIAGVAIVFVMTPAFVEKYISSDHHLTPEGTHRLLVYRIIALIVSLLSIAIGHQLKKVQRITIKNDTIALYLGLLAWGILYILYLKNHTIPVNPAGYYLESARQLIQNGYKIPEYLRGFGIPGIPFAYPPLGLYVYAIGGMLIGDISTAALILPGLLLPVQAFAGYLFVKQYTGSKQAAQWAGVFLLLVPHLFYRTLWGDGITTGLSGIFLLFSWYFAVKPKTIGQVYHNPVLGGLFVGLSILSHPGIGLFCAVSYAILYISCAGLKITSFKGLILGGITALALSLIWVLPVISTHGIDPLLASISDQKSPLLKDIFNTLSYSYSKHFGNEQEMVAMVLFPIGVSTLYSVIRSPLVILPLLLSTFFTFRGHPSVTMFVFALCIGIFYKDALLKLYSTKTTEKIQEKSNPIIHIESFSFLAFVFLHIGILFFLSRNFANFVALDDGEMESYIWIRTNTQPNSTFLIEEIDENLVYFGERTILLPTLGAEWIPDPEYGNASVRNFQIVNDIFSCREIDCITKIFSQYNLKPDYIIYRVSNESEENFIETLAASPLFEKVFSSGRMVILYFTDRYH